MDQQLLKTLKPKGLKDEDLAKFRKRLAARAILFSDHRICLIFVAKHNYYMLPGGGIENETIEVGLRRELKEEVGINVDIITEIGQTILYNPRFRVRQLDRCFIVRQKGDSKLRDITPLEKSDGHQIVWANSLKDAYNLALNTDPKTDDGILIKQRDLIFINKVIKDNKFNP